MILRVLAVAVISLACAAAIILPKLKLGVPAADSFSQKVKPEAVANADLRPVKKITYKDPPAVTADSIVVVDSKTGSTLYEKNVTLKHFPASVAKLVTALVALEKCLPADVVIVGTVEKEGTQMGLAASDKVTVENLLYGLLINSGNDAAAVLADNCSNSGEKFVQSMNEKAQNLGMQNSHFMNPTGFDNNFQYSTAGDLAKLGNVAISNPLIAKIVATKSTVVTNVSGTKSYYLENVNELLGKVEGIQGIKTGQTVGALENLVTKTTRGGNAVVVVVLGSKDRFLESKNLIEWAFDNFNWVLD